MTTSRGVTRTASILDRIVADKRDALEARKMREPASTLTERFDGPWHLTLSSTKGPRLPAAQAKVQVIAEIKKASPSKGVLAPDLDYLAVARAYALGGAAGISVLTEENYFLGSLDHLRDIRRRLAEEFPGQRPSLLRKDFLIDPYELLQSRAYGADNVLLIAALLELSLLRDLIQKAQALGLEALVEVHDETEAERAIAAGATLYGINNRDLRTFEVDLAVTERLRPLLPADAVVIGESGVHTRADVERLHRAGVQAILVGEAFMTAPDIPAKLAELRPEPDEGLRPEPDEGRRQ
jgi:indole-3-glycerol phosphate synthase